MANSDKKTRRPQLEGRFAARRKQILSAIKGEAAIFPSAAPQRRSRDADHPYTPNSDLFYLTGITEPQTILVLLGLSKGPRSILYLRDRDPAAEQWTGERIGLKRAKKRFAVDEVRPIGTFRSDLPQLLKDIRVLNFTAGVDSEIDNLIWNQYRSAVGPRHNFPSTLKDARLLTAEMRSVKDRDEIRSIRHAADITAYSFAWIAGQLSGCTSELHAARLLEAEFSRLGGTGIAFDTIVASGRNAVSLHHRPTLQPLWRQEFVLVDAGASFNGYSADVTRTFPISGRFTKPQAALYDVVLRALRTTAVKAKPGLTLADLHQNAVTVLTEGLVELKLLRGSVEQLVSQGRYKRFFMHRLGHWLGIDVHDISPLDGGKSGIDGHPSHHRPLVPGNLFTAEPGLYVDAKDESVPREFRGIGIRLEDDLLITDSGCEVLTGKLPVEREQVEALVNGGESRDFL